ncbi:MAG: SHOCT domain-containing protein [Actinomycetota bacterium]|nr:SHOCT domain-containing protein [Actinomycetota bacterium]
MMNWDNGGMGTGWGILMLVGMTAVVVLVVLGVGWLIRAGRGERSRPEQILDDRLARGEIDPEEHRVRRAAIVRQS